MKRMVPALFLILAVGCSDGRPCPAADLPALETLPSFAVVDSDYTSSAIALLDAEGALLDGAWVDSGSAAPGIVAALSGDVSLPTAPVTGGELMLLDRFGVDVVDRFDLRAGAVLSQLDVQLSSREGSSGFRANPHDAVRLEDGTFLVSRFEPNLDPAAPPLDAGNDLVRVGDDGPISRIAMGALDATVEGTTIFARPGRIAPLGDAFVVGLGRFGYDFGVVGPGAVAVVTLDPPSVIGLDLPGLANCPSVRPSPEGDAVLVLCTGPYEARSPERRRTAGIVRLVDAGEGPEIAQTWRAAEHPESPVPTQEPVPLGGMRVATPAIDEAESADRLIVVDLATGDVVEPYVAARTFVLGVGVFDAGTSLLLVPDADAGIVRFHVDGASLTPMDPVEASPCRALPPREIGRLVP